MAPLLYTPIPGTVGLSDVASGGVKSSKVHKAKMAKHSKKKGKKSKQEEQEGQKQEEVSTS